MTTIIRDEGQPHQSEDPRLHVRIEEDLRARIADGRLRPGQAAPSIAELRRAYGCCRQTAARPLQRLVEEGLLVRYPGLGYYVR